MLAFAGIADAMQVIVRAVISLAPIGVVALVIPLVAHTGSAFAGATVRYLVVYSAASVLMMFLLYPVVRVAGRMPIARFARAAVPPQLIAFTSSSSVASLPAMVEAANGPLALPPRAAGFALPVAVSTFKIAAPLAWSIGANFLGWFYGVPITAASLATIAFAGVFLSFATPGVPNGAFLLVTPLFAQIGIPAEGIGVLIALDAIPDRFTTMLNVTGDLAAATIIVASDADGASVD
jgi:Na+/H+-dicarboxylate symporter